jgi:hypothetical protein
VDILPKQGRIDARYLTNKVDTYPERQIDLALFSNELQNTSMSHSLLHAIDELEEHGIRNM